MKSQEEILSELEKELGRGRIKFNEPMSSHTTFQVGGPADYYFEANTVVELVEVVELAKQLCLAYFILGGGSNILVGDKGFRGLVIKNNSHSIRIKSYKGKMEKGKFGLADVLVEVDCGVPFNLLVRFTLDEGLTGLEEFLGLPGSVGGAVMVNAHWHDKRIRDFIVSEKKVDDTLLSVILKLRKEGGNENLWEKAKQTVIYRQTRHPKDPSAGCIFKNIQKSQAMVLGTPGFTTSSAYLIEAVGLKGIREGNAQISTLHANFIVNLGGAKAYDVVKLIELIKEKVKTRFGIGLEEEIIKVGEF